MTSQRREGPRIGERVDALKGPAGATIARPNGIGNEQDKCGAFLTRLRYVKVFRKLLNVPRPE
jgi:hypothetical protein